MMIAREIAIASPSEAKAMGLPAGEFGIVFAEEGERRITLAGDAEFVRKLRDTPHSLLAGVEIPPGKFPLKRAGW